MFLTIASVAGSQRGHRRVSPPDPFQYTFLPCRLRNDEKHRKVQRSNHQNPVRNSARSQATTTTAALAFTFHHAAFAASSFVGVPGAASGV
jgi:hypothetical protein